MEKNIPCQPGSRKLLARPTRRRYRLAQCRETVTSLLTVTVPCLETLRLLQDISSRPLSCYVLSRVVSFSFLHSVCSITEHCIRYGRHVCLPVCLSVTTYIDSSVSIRQKIQSRDHDCGYEAKLAWAQIRFLQLAQDCLPWTTDWVPALNPQPLRYYKPETTTGALHPVRVCWWRYQWRVICTTNLPLSSGNYRAGFQAELL